MKHHNRKIAIVGLGTVGLTLGAALSQYGNVLGFDVNESRIAELKKNLDRNGTFSKEALRKADLRYSANPNDLISANFYIIAVPTSVDSKNKPDLAPLKSASQLVGRFLKKGDIVVYESTDYPGATEGVCIPELEKSSQLKSNHDFSVGYSPERINPGDPAHKMESIVKLIAAQNPEALKIIGHVYESVIKAGVHPVSSIKVAEASKIVENIQRDVNIALVNEIALILHKMEVDTREVLEAAATKWSFHCYSPGLVGGDCIAVDPYYLIFRSMQLGYTPEVISASRHVNSMMVAFISDELVNALKQLNIPVSGAKVAILGFAFKENYPEIKNTRVMDLIKALKKHHIQVVVSDPLTPPDLVKEEYDVHLTPFKEIHNVDALIFAVAHDQYKQLNEKEIIKKLSNQKGVIMDIKRLFSKQNFTGNEIIFWSL